MISIRDRRKFVNFLDAARAAARGTVQEMLGAGCSPAQANATERALTYLFLEEEARRLARAAIFAEFSPAMAEQLLAEMSAGIDDV
jgi:hypothetical protein